LEHILGQEWEITPAGGKTGEAFYAKYEDQRLFLKRNSSPFLAVLSAEGIVPKLVWTKRLESGDVITAQQWLPGRELKPSEMNQELVA
jgi:thiamine kinase-like enzyme